MTTVAETTETLARANGRPPDLYCNNLRDAATELRRPFTPAAIRFKVQVQYPKDNPNAAIVVAYIDARLVIERLNRIVPDLWFANYEPLGDTHMICRLTVDGITREDVGQSPSKGDWKYLYSDSLKRAAVHFGIGVSVYAMSQVRLQKGEHLEIVGSQKKTARITPNGETWLRDMYGAWLGVKGHIFGEPLDHGDVEDSAGAEQPAPAAERSSSAEQVSPHAQNPEAKKLDRDNEEAMVAAGMPPGKVQAKLDAARTLTQKRALRDELAREPAPA